MLDSLQKIMMGPTPSKFHGLIPQPSSKWRFRFKHSRFYVKHLKKNADQRADIENVYHYDIYLVCIKACLSKDPASI